MVWVHWQRPHLALLVWPQFNHSKNQSNNKQPDKPNSCKRNWPFLISCHDIYHLCSSTSLSMLIRTHKPKGLIVDLNHVFVQLSPGILKAQLLWHGMTQKICRCVRRLTVEDTCLHDVLGNMESLCESQVLWSKWPTKIHKIFIILHPSLAESHCYQLRSHFRSLLRFFTRPYSPKYCTFRPSSTQEWWVGRMRTLYIISAYFSNEFGSLHSLRWWFRTMPIQVFQDFQDWVASSFTTPVDPGCITKQIGNPGSVAYASWPVCLIGLTLLRLVHVPDGSSCL